ncbi:uncharacterized protein [Euphorbia lathyris]|uniref:uncharacterized protein n=1 Tax=Euphorbia lathyris TaxID=212925 RepID=UPI0033140980
MKDDDAPTLISIPSPTSTTSTAVSTSTKKDILDAGSLFGKVRYKFWVLSAILLLAFWSMFTGSVTLKWSTGSLSHLSDDLDFQIHDDDLDILELEEKEKVVRHMWDVYTHSSTAKLARFWQEAFEAAYEAMASDVPVVRNDAVSEIAKMSLRTFNPLQSSSKIGKSRSSLVAEESKPASQ